MMNKLLQIHQIAVAFRAVLSRPPVKLIIDTVNWLYNNAESVSSKCTAAEFLDTANKKMFGSLKLMKLFITL